MKWASKWERNRGSILLDLQKSQISDLNTYFLLFEHAGKHLSHWILSLSSITKLLLCFSYQVSVYVPCYWLSVQILIRERRFCILCHNKMTLAVMVVKGNYMKPYPKVHLRYLWNSICCSSAVMGFSLYAFLYSNILLYSHWDWKCPYAYSLIWGDVYLRLPMQHKHKKLLEFSFFQPHL